MKWILFASVVFASFILAISEPKWVAENRFLDVFVSHEILGIMIVLLSITIAAVASINIGISRLRQDLAKVGVDISREANNAKHQLTINLISMFVSVSLIIIILIIKGGFYDDNFVVSICHALSVVLLVFNLLILYDIYAAIYEITSFEIPDRKT